MKILCVVKTSDGARWLVSQVETMVARGHEVTVLLPSADGSLGPELIAAGARLSPMVSGISGSRVHRLPWDLLRMRRAIRAERPQIVFYQLWASAVMARLATFGLHGLRRVHMVPGPLFLEALPLRLAERVLVRMDDVLVAGSRHTAERYLQLGMPPDRLHVIPYGTDLRRFQPGPGRERARVRAELGIAPDAFVAVMVALVYGGKAMVHRNRPIKGHEDLLAAWRSFEPEGRPKHLLLVGDGFDPGGRQHRERLLRAFDIEADPAVTWLPTAADVRPYYAVADVSVSPSLSDNHGAAVEAAAMGVPSVVSDAGALGEVAEGSGWIFAAGDRHQLAARLRDAASESPADLARRGRVARRHAEARFDGEALRDQLVRLLEEVAARRASPRS